MGYRRALVLRWSRRDRLALLVVAVTVAFVTGSTLVGLAVSEQTTQLAGEYESSASLTQYDTVADARSNAGDGEAVFVLARVDVDGTTYPVLGVPPDSPQISGLFGDTGFPSVESETLRATGSTVERTGTKRVETDGVGRLPVVVRPSNELIPDDWYVTTAETATELDVTGAFVLTTEAGSGVGESGDRGATPLSALGVGGDSSVATPLVAVLVFFVRGTAQLLSLVGLATAGGSVLVAVTVYSVTRMSVEDRRPDIAVVRSTGAGPWAVLSVFAFRALLLTAVGAALGFALGTVLTRLVVNVAVFAGLPASVNVRVTEAAVWILVPAIALLLAVGGLAGGFAARGAVRTPPARVLGGADSRGGSSASRLREALSPTVLDWSALVPTTATLSVFVAFVLLVTAIGSAAAPLADTDEQTITQPDVPHPIASNVPTVYADALRSQGVAASAEILLFQVNDGVPFVARGVNYTAYADLSDTRLVAGRAPETENEVLVGDDVAQALGVGVGDTLVLGGFLRPAVTQVTVVGRFEGTGIQDDQVLLSLDTAQHLANKGEGSAMFIRTGGADGEGSPVVPVDVSVRDTENGTTVTLLVQNYALAERTETLSVSLGDRQETVEATLPPNRQSAVEVEFDDLSPGTYDLETDGLSTTVTVDESGRISAAGSNGQESEDSVGDEGTGLSLSAPTEAPPNSRPVLTLTRNGTGTAGTVEVGNRSFEAGDDGRVTVQLGAPGTYRLRATPSDAPNGSTVTRRIDVTTDAVRRWDGAATVDPDVKTVTTRPRLRVTVSNPWNETVSKNVTVNAPGGRSVRQLSVGPGATTTFTVRLPRRPPGTYSVGVFADGQLVETTYRITGDARLASALAGSGVSTAGGGIGRAIEVAFGNIQVLLASLVLLTALMTVGGTTASFTRAIRARREELGVRRATGATPRALFALVLGDALRVGVVAASGAVVASTVTLTTALSLGGLRVFGVALAPTISPAVVAGAAAGAVALALASAGVATYGMVRVPPAALLAPRSRGDARPEGGVRSRPTDDRPGRPGATRADGGDPTRTGDAVDSRTAGDGPGRTTTEDGPGTGRGANGGDTDGG